MNIETILGTTVLLVLAASGMTWSVIIRRLVKGDDLLPFEPRPQVPWYGTWVCLAFVIYLGLTAAVMLATAAVFSGAEETIRLSAGLAATGVAHLLAMVMIAAMLFAGTSATPFDLGLRGNTLVGDIRLGIITFVAVAPPVYLLQGLLSRFNDKSHDVIEMLQQNQAPLLFAASTFVAVIAAPLAEEFLFRVVLQGWLERRFEIGSPPSSSAPAGESQLADDPSADGMLAPHDRAAAETGNPYAPPQPVSPIPAAPTLAPRPYPEIFPILISSAVFALFHLGQGLAPIALFFLALALGFLYQRTHRIAPCITVHLLLNGTSMLMLWLLLKFDLME